MHLIFETENRTVVVFPRGGTVASVKYVILGFACAALSAAPEPQFVKPKVESSQAAHKDAVQKEYEKLVAMDEAALEAVEKMGSEFQAFEAQGAAGSRAALAAKIDQRLEPVRKAYKEFLAKHPQHVDAHLAYGSFLNELAEEEEAIVQWEKARSLDPSNPSAWNNLANIYAHIGPIKKAFQYYEKAVELNPKEPVYIQNLAVVTYLFRKDAAETYRIDEEAVFQKALDLYRRAMKLDPTNIVLATDYAQSFYGIRPLRAEEAISAWKHALTLAKSDAEKQGIHLHLARVQLNSGRFAEAEAHLGMVNDPSMSDLKERLRKNLEAKRAEASSNEKAPTKAEAITSNQAP